MGLTFVCIYSDGRWTVDDLVSLLRNVVDVHRKSIWEGIYNDIVSIDEAHQLATASTLEITSKDKTDNAQEEEDSPAQAFIYGEIEYDSFVKILRIATNGLPKCEKFCDLGSGTGRALLLTALMCDFRVILGIELLSGTLKATTALIKSFFFIPFAD